MDRLDAKRAQVLNAFRGAKGLDGRDGLRVAQVMTLTPSCISAETSVLELVKLFHQKQFRHLMVTDGAGRLVGVVSDRDVIRCLGPDKHPKSSVLAQITAAAIMSTDLVTVSPNTPLDRAVTLMIDQGISCLPVLAEGGLVGILTNTDLHVVLQVLLQTVRRSSSAKSLATSTPSRQI